MPGIDAFGTQQCDQTDTGRDKADRQPAAWHSRSPLGRDHRRGQPRHQLPQLRAGGIFCQDPWAIPRLWPERSQDLPGRRNSEGFAESPPRRKHDQAGGLDKGNFWAGLVQKFPVECFTSRLGLRNSWEFSRQRVRGSDEQFCTRVCRPQACGPAASRQRGEEAVASQTGLSRPLVFMS